jgi:hypothetical protein
MSALTPIANKLAKCIRMLSSDKTGDVIAAAQGLCRMLESVGADIHALAAIVEHGGELNEAEMKKLYNAGHEAGYHKGVRAAENKLQSRESEFVDHMASLTVWREPSEKQGKWLKSIFYKLGGKRQ